MNGICARACVPGRWQPSGGVAAQAGVKYGTSTICQPPSAWRRALIARSSPRSPRWLPQRGAERGQPPGGASQFGARPARGCTRSQSTSTRT